VQTIVSDDDDDELMLGHRHNSEQSSDELLYTCRQTTMYRLYLDLTDLSAVGGVPCIIYDNCCALLKIMYDHAHHCTVTWSDSGRLC